MIALFISFSIAVYVFVAIKLYKLIFLTKPTATRIVFIFFVMALPTWNVVVNSVLYSYYSYKWGGVNIYEKAYSDSFYYSSIHDSVVMKDNEYYWPGFEKVLKGFKKIEVEINRVKINGSYVEDHFYCGLSMPGKFMPDRFLLCERQDFITSEYAVIHESSQVLGVRLDTIKVLHSPSARILGESRFASMKIEFPFFSWLGWNQFPSGRVVSGTVEDRQGFVFKVLHPTTKRWNLN